MAALNFMAACLTSSVFNLAVAQSGSGSGPSKPLPGKDITVAVVVGCCIGVTSIMVFAVYIKYVCMKPKGDDNGGDWDGVLLGQKKSSSKVHPSSDSAPNQSRPKKMTTGASSSSLGSLAEGIAAPVGSRPKSASRPNITPARVPVAKKGAVKGNCSRCGKAVYETEERQKDEKGYFHTSPADCEVLARVQRGSINLDGQNPAE